MAPAEKRTVKAPADVRPTIAKRPWQPPRVRTGHLFESNSLACGKSTPQMDQCLQNPVTS